MTSPFLTLMAPVDGVVAMGEGLLDTHGERATAVAHQELRGE